MTTPQGTAAANHEHNGAAVHNYVEHVTGTLGAQMLTPDQAAYGGYQRISPTLIQARSTITGLHPVIEQAISDVKEKDPSLTGEALERRIAQKLTELNDWENLTSKTQTNLMLLSGLDISSMRRRQREDQVNHLLHSPLPYGDLAEVLTPDVKIDLGYTHTLEKERTKVADLGGGVFQIWMVSNNNNGSHTDHSLGSFKVQLPAGTTVDQARQIGNQMVTNKNKNEKLYLDQAARNVLYGLTPPLNLTQGTPPQTTTTMAVTTTSTTAPMTTSTTAASTTTSTTAAQASTTASTTSTSASASSSSVAPSSTSTPTTSTSTTHGHSGGG